MKTGGVSRREVEVSRNEVNVLRMEVGGGRIEEDCCFEGGECVNERECFWLSESVTLL